AAITATINDQKLEQFDRERVQEIVTASLGGEPHLRVDDGGGLHDAATGARVGTIRRTPSGEWITERQNPEAHRSDTAVPSPSPRTSATSPCSFSLCSWSWAASCSSSSASLSGSSRSDSLIIEPGYPFAGPRKRVALLAWPWPFSISTARWSTPTITTPSPG